MSQSPKAPTSSARAPATARYRMGEMDVSIKVKTTNPTRALQPDQRPQASLRACGINRQRKLGEPSSFKMLEFSELFTIPSPLQELSVGPGSAAIAIKERHPRELPILFLTEMWERFSFYLMIGILPLYLVDHSKGGMGWSSENRSILVGSYMGLVYFTPFLGGI